jgi:DNA-binding beta-propeller fold protein YncE
VLPHTALDDSSSRCPPDVCVSAVLGDAQRRVAVLGGREGMPRSLGSVYGGSVTRFLGSALRSTSSRRVIATPRVKSRCSGVAVSVDGCMLLVSDWYGGSHAIHELSVVDGSQRRAVGGAGTGPLRFNRPCQVYIAPDGFVFVADYGNNRVQVLTSSLNFHCFIGEGDVRRPIGVCANADVVVVGSEHEHSTHRVAVFNRNDGTLLRRFGGAGSGDGELMAPRGLCFVTGDRHVAVADFNNYRVSVFDVAGDFIRHIGVGVLNGPLDVAATAVDELVVADFGSVCLRVFSSAGDLLASVGEGVFTGVAVHGRTVFASDGNTNSVSVYS